MALVLAARAAARRGAGPLLALAAPRALAAHGGLLAAATAAAPGAGPRMAAADPAIGHAVAPFSTAAGPSALAAAARATSPLRPFGHAGAGASSRLLSGGPGFGGGSGGGGAPPRRDDEERDVPEKSSAFTRGAGAVTTGALLLWGKTKWVLGALKFTKFMPALSMLASTGAYAFFYGWPFAVGMVGLIAVHESGHLLVMKSLGVPAGPMVFIPFIGASVEMKDRPKDVREEALIAFGGPVVGGAGAVALSAAGVAMDSQMLVALADFGIMINLFNLLPIGSLDGGRIGGAISPMFLAAGLAGGIGMAYHGVVSNPLFYLILLSGAFTTYDRFFGEGTHDSYYRIPPSQRAGLTGAYILLIAVLLAAMAWNAQHKKSLRQLRRENPQAGASDMGSRLERFAEDWADDDEARRAAALEQEFIARHFEPRP